MIFWQMIAAFWAGLAVGGLGAAYEAWQDRQMIRRLNAQAWYPRIGMRTPTTTELNEL